MEINLLIWYLNKICMSYENVCRWCVCFCYWYPSTPVIPHSHQAGMRMPDIFHTYIWHSIRAAFLSLYRRRFMLSKTAANAKHMFIDQTQSVRSQIPSKFTQIALKFEYTSKGRRKNSKIKHIWIRKSQTVVIFAECLAKGQPQNWAFMANMMWARKMLLNSIMLR